MAWTEEVQGMGLVYYDAEDDDTGRLQPGWYWQRDGDWACSILYPTRAAALTARRNGTIEWEE